MSFVTFSLLLLSSLINVNFGRTTTKQMSHRVVDMPGGQLRAVVISRPGLRSVEAFLGVHYATAERFRQPTTSTYRWQGVRTTRDFGPVCPQRIPDMDRNCSKTSCSVLGKFTSGNSRHGSAVIWLMLRSPVFYREFQTLMN